MPIIDSLDYGEIKISGKTFYSDMVVYWDGRKKLLPKTHILDLPLMKRILDRKPESVIVGIGLEGTVKIHPSVKRSLEKHKIKLFVEQTAKAAEIFNAFLQEGKKVVAIMHVTL